MKRLILTLLVVTMCFTLCACTENDTFDADGAKDAIGKYAEQIEKSKDELVEGLDKLQGMLEDNVD